jgi:hypothetical protein
VEHIDERCFTWVGSGLTLKLLTWLEKLVREKCSSLLLKFVNYGGKKFYNIGAWFHHDEKKVGTNWIEPV